MPKEINVTSVLNKTKRRDPWFLDDYTINMYSSCSFNCLYCYIRGSKYGTNLEKSLAIKMNALEILDRQLFNQSKKNQYGIIVLSSVTDPYIQIEKKYQHTREALKLIAKYKFPAHIITKSDLIERDFDVLHEINKNAIIPNDLVKNLPGGAIISFSFSTLDHQVAKIFEKGATKPKNRLIALEKTIKAGFYSGVSLMPLLPFISDTTAQLDLFFTTFKRLGAHYVLPASLSLFGNGPADSKTLMLAAIKKHYPHLEAKYLSYFKDARSMPVYYQTAFKKKMLELARTYQLSNRILQR